jgi:hypothetical protein
LLSGFGLLRRLGVTEYKVGELRQRSARRQTGKGAGDE